MNKQKRPYTTYYYNMFTPKLDLWTTQGHSSTYEGAVKGAAWRIWLCRKSVAGYKMARILNENMRVIDTMINVNGEVHKIDPNFKLRRVA